MRKARKVGAILATTGVAVFGAVTAMGGVANAATNRTMDSCTQDNGQLASGALLAECKAGTSSVGNPTGITVSVDPTFFTVLLGNTAINQALGGVLSAQVTYTLSCSVNGGTVTSTNDTGFTVTSAATATHVIDLQSAVGSPGPKSCTLADLTVTSPVSGSILSQANALGLQFSLGVKATADTGIPGTIYTTAPADKQGAIPAICADDPGNANAGAEIDVFTCMGDLAQRWLQVSTNQFVHNGDCLDEQGGTVMITGCVANPGTSNSQVWSTRAEGHGYSELVNTGTGQCLTAAKPKDGSAVTLTDCTGASDQLWKVPAVTPK